MRCSQHRSTNDAEPHAHRGKVQSRSVKHARFLAGALVLLLVISACAARDGDEIGGAPIFNGTTPDGQTVEPPITTLPAPQVNAIRVPVDAQTIQEAVDLAQPGDLILIEPGSYFEQVVITQPDIVVRGRDRNSVFVDGSHQLDVGISVLADGVALENLTIRNYVSDAISVEAGDDAVPRDGFRALHVTTSNSGDSGIALRNTQNAEIRQGWFSGHGTAGVTVTGCTDCATLITTSLAEFNARGFWVQGATNGVSIFASTSRNNRTGIVVDDGADAPTAGAIIAGSLIQNNGFSQSPGNENQEWENLYGVGVHIGGTVDSSVSANRIEGNLRAGVLLSPNVDQTSDDPIATRVERNITGGHPEGDVVLASRDGVVDPGLCIANNSGANVAPPGAAEAATCSNTSTAPPLLAWTGEPRPSIPHQNVAVPPIIDGMGDADTAAPIPAGPVTLPDPTTAVAPGS